VEKLAGGDDEEEEEEETNEAPCCTHLAPRRSNGTGPEQSLWTTYV